MQKNDIEWWSDFVSIVCLSAPCRFTDTFCASLGHCSSPMPAEGNGVDSFLVPSQTLTCVALPLLAWPIVGTNFSEWVQKICSRGNQFRGIQMKLGQGDLGDGDCYLMQILVYLCRTHFLPSRYHCVPMKCAGFTRNQASSGSRSMATTPSLSRTRIVSSGRKEAVQTSMKSQWREGSMKLTCWIESVNPSTG